MSGSPTGCFQAGAYRGAQRFQAWGFGCEIDEFDSGLGGLCSREFCHNGFRRRQR